MKEFVLVEFIFEHEHAELAGEAIRNLGDDFKYLESSTDFEVVDDSGITDSWFRISGEINSTTATVIRLSNEFLSDRMRISYISEDLKNKYRR